MSRQKIIADALRDGEAYIRQSGDWELLSSIGLDLRQGTATRSNFYMETQGCADDDTVTFDWPSGNGGMLFLLGATTSSIAVNRSAIMFFQGTSAPTVIWESGVSIASGATNPDTDGFTNVWPSSATQVSIKNRESNFSYYTVYMLTGDA